jgi:maltose-binding protein MalE
MALLLFGSISLSAQSAPQELILWHSYTEGTIKQLLQNAADEAKAETGVVIRIEYIDNGNIKPSLLKNAKSGKLPQMVFAAADFVGIQKELNLSPIKWHLKGSDDQLETVKLGKEIYAAPITGGNHLLLYFNRSKVKVPAQSFDELVKTSAQRPVIAWNYDEPYWIVPFIGSKGAWPLQEGKVSLNRSGVGEAFRDYYELKDGLKLGPCDYTCSQKAFVEEKVDYLINGVWAYGELKEKLGDKLGVALLPKLKGKDLVPMFSTIALLFPDQSLDKDKTGTLKAFIRILQSEKVQKNWASLGHIPILPNVASPKDPNWDVVLGQLKQARAMPSDPAMVWAWEALRKGWGLYKSLREKDKPNAESKAMEYMQGLAEKEISQHLSH